MSETPILDFPFPKSTGLVAEGAVNIEQLAEAVEANTLAPAVDSSVLITSYPIGVTVMTVAAGGSGWPRSASASVLTVRRASSDTGFQLWSRNTLASDDLGLWYRAGQASGWSGWYLVTGANTADEQATGSVSCAMQEGDESARAFTVTLPTKRFSGAGPRIFLTPATSQPKLVSVSAWATSATAFVLYYLRTVSGEGAVNTGPTTVNWHAIKMRSEVQTLAAQAISAEARWAICQNPDCQEYRQPINIGPPLTDPETGEVVDMTYLCGACGQEITDIRTVRPPTPDDEPDELAE